MVGGPPAGPGGFSGSAPLSTVLVARPQRGQNRLPAGTSPPHATHNMALPPEVTAVLQGTGDQRMRVSRADLSGILLGRAGGVVCGTPVGGYITGMNTLDENLVRDTICGLELQLIDAVERQERAEIQHDGVEADRIQGEIDGLQARLAAVAEVVATLD